MMYYRKDLFEEAGIEMSEQPTWSEVRDWAEQLHGAQEGWRVSAYGANPVGVKTWPSSPRWPLRWPLV